MLEDADRLRYSLKGGRGLEAKTGLGSEVGNLDVFQGK